MTAQTTLTTRDQIGALVTVINLVRTGKASTRPELGRASRLGRSIITQRVEQAIDQGYLADSDLGLSTGGRAPRKLRFRAELGRFLAVEFGALHVSVAVLDLDLDIRRQTHSDWDISVGPEASLEFVSTVLDQLIQEDGGAPVWGVTVGVPGPVEFRTGRPIAPPIMPGWNAFDIREWFEARYGAPVFVDNDVNLMALGEFEAREYGRNDDILFLKVGSGIGAGLVSAGHIHRGANGAAGDVGHIAVGGGLDAICRCGQLGCLEAVAGGWALARDGVRAAEDGRSPFLAQVLSIQGSLHPADIARGAVSGDAVCVDLVTTSARTVGEMLATLVNVFNPAVVAVGGTVAETGDLFLSAVRQIVYRRSLPLATRELRIVPSTAGHNDGIIGAGRLMADRVFDPETMEGWLPTGGPHLALGTVYGVATERAQA